MIDQDPALDSFLPPPAPEPRIERAEPACPPALAPDQTEALVPRPHPARPVADESLARHALADQLAADYPSEFLAQHLLPAAIDVLTRIGLFAHSPDYRTCSWAGREYTFNRAEAAIVRALHEDLAREGLGLTRSELLAAAKLQRDDERIDHVFRHVVNGRYLMNPAWTDGLVLCVGRGRYRLALAESPVSPPDSSG